MSQELNERQMLICQALQGIVVTGSNHGAEKRGWDMIEYINFGRGWPSLVNETVSDSLLYGEAAWELVYASSDIKLDCAKEPDGRLLAIATLSWPKCTVDRNDRAWLIYTDDDGVAYRLHPKRTLRMSSYLSLTQGVTEQEHYRQAFKMALEQVIPDVTIGWEDEQR